MGASVVSLVGGLRNFGLMEEIVKNNEADFISICRPLIREPHLVNIWKIGDRKRPECISCNKCLKDIFKHPLHCKEKAAETNHRRSDDGTTV